MSRTLLSLERVLGVRLLHRTSRSLAPTTAGVQVLARARQLLAEGLCDRAVVRTPPDERRYASAVVGRERRYCAVAADDPWARRRSIRLEEVRDRTVAIDRRTGTTTTDLWPPGTEPAVEDTQDIDDWLALITSGRYVGITPESTVTQYRHPGIAFRPCATPARSPSG